MKSAELKREAKRGLTFTLTSDFSCIASVFICERKFYARTYARKNYATLQINHNLLEILYHKKKTRTVIRRPWNTTILLLLFTLFYCFSSFIIHSRSYRPSKASHVRAYNGHREILAPIDLFHNGGLLIYSFIRMISRLSDLVWKWEFVRILHMLTRSERLIIIHIKE